MVSWEVEFVEGNIQLAISKMKIPFLKFSGTSIFSYKGIRTDEILLGDENIC